MAELNTDNAKIPPGVRLYVIGDIHGRLDLLKQLIAIIVANENVAPSLRPVLIFLGDYIDRGPDSRGVIDYLIHDLPPGFQRLYLRGNHEDMMLRTLEAPPGPFQLWAANGGLAALESYRVEIGHSESLPSSAMQMAIAKLEKSLPVSHRKFLTGLRIWAKVGDFFFVHAGVRPGIPLRQQAEHDCLYIRDEFLRHEGNFEKVIVHGHTPVREPEIWPNRIGIDTGAVFTGRLTALCLEGERKTFFTTVHNGEPQPI